MNGMLPTDIITFETTDFDYSGSFNKDTEALTAYMKRLHQFFDGNKNVKCTWVLLYLEGNDVGDIYDYTLHKRPIFIIAVHEF